MGAARDILHLNVADFAVEVERLVDTRLRGRPVIVAPEGAARAAVFDHSEEAYRSGVRKGMPLQRALRCCRDAVVLPPHVDRYERAMKEMLKKALPYSPLIEQTDTQGHLFVDLSGTSRLHGKSQDIGLKIRKTLKDDIGFDPIWTVAPNKLLAKVASRLVKPTGERIVSPDEAGELLQPLPLYLIPGLEYGDIRRFRELNIYRVGEARNLEPEQLDILFGKRHHYIHSILQGLDDSPVLPVGNKAPQIVMDHPFGNDTNDVHIVEGVLYSLVERIGSELRKRQLAAKRLMVGLDYSDGKRIFRYLVLRPATADDFRLFDIARELLQKTWMRRVRIRHLRIKVDRLTYPPVPQLNLFEDVRKEQDDKSNLIVAMDSIRNRFGFSAVNMGRTLSGLGARDLGLVSATNFRSYNPPVPKTQNREPIP